MTPFTTSSNGGIYLLECAAAAFGRICCVFSILATEALESPITLAILGMNMAS